MSAICRKRALSAESVGRSILWLRCSFNVRFATLPSKSLKPHLEHEISVHIAICKSMSQNLHDEMSCCTIPSRLPCLFYDTECLHFSSGMVSHGGERHPFTAPAHPQSR